MTERIYEKEGTLLKPKEVIIRCKDCKYWNLNRLIADNTSLCERFNYYVEQDGYCCVGKPKEEGDA